MRTMSGPPPLSGPGTDKETGISFVPELLKSQSRKPPRKHLRPALGGMSGGFISSLEVDCCGSPLCSGTGEGLTAEPRCSKTPEM